MGPAACPGSRLGEQVGEVFAAARDADDDRVGDPIEAGRELDRDIRRSSEGAADLGVLATLGFFAAGAAEVVGSGELPLPPWFNLAWWGFRTFMTTEATAIESVE